MRRIRIIPPSRRFFNSGVPFVLHIRFTDSEIFLEPRAGRSGRLCAVAPVGCCGKPSWSAWCVEVLAGGRQYIPHQIYPDLDAWLRAALRRAEER